jgi:chaperone modulatory protein CbpM
MSMQEIHSIEILADGSISLIEMLAVTRIERLRMIEMVDAGLLEPVGSVIEQWQFASRDLRRLRAALRLMEDLDVNLAGAALILDLIEERDALRARVTMLQQLITAD